LANSWQTAKHKYKKTSFGVITPVAYKGTLRGRAKYNFALSAVKNNGVVKNKQKRAVEANAEHLLLLNCSHTQWKQWKHSNSKKKRACLFHNKLHCTEILNELQSHCAKNGGDRFCCNRSSWLQSHWN